jgi:ABC-type bacteriocin/lantibiotic exporter with double-glycine peptidase domain
MNIPLYSQHLDVTKEEWRHRACGVVALLMVMEALKKEKIATPDELIEKGLELEAYKEGVGWYHKGLVRIAEAYGFKGENFDWTFEPEEKAFAELLEKLAEGPVLASMKNESGGHIVTLLNLTNDQATLLDPSAKTPEEIEVSVSLEAFKKSWTRRIIVVRN